MKIVDYLLIVKINQNLVMIRKELSVLLLKYKCIFAKMPLLFRIFKIP